MNPGCREKGATLIKFEGLNFCLKCYYSMKRETLWPVNNNNISMINNVLIFYSIFFPDCSFLFFQSWNQVFCLLKAVSLFFLLGWSTLVGLLLLISMIMNLLWNVNEGLVGRFHPLWNTPFIFRVIDFDCVYLLFKAIIFID